MGNAFRFDTECPLEIWQLILDFACDEESLLAIFLSQVSRRFHKMCKGHLQHITVGSTPELLELDTYLRNELPIPRRHHEEHAFSAMFCRTPSRRSWMSSLIHNPRMGNQMMDGTSPLPSPQNQTMIAVPVPLHIPLRTTIMSTKTLPRQKCRRRTRYSRTYSMTRRRSD